MTPEAQASPESEPTLLGDANEAIAKANEVAGMREEEPVLEAEESELAPTDEPVEKSAKSPETVQDVPIWFLRHCVKTVDEIRAVATPIIARERKHEPAQRCSEHPSGDLQLKDGDSYLVDSTILESITRFRTAGEILEEDVELFRHDAVHIRFPANSRTPGGSHFLEALIQWFAVRAQATLVTLSKDDLLDLAAYFGADGSHEAGISSQGSDSSQDSDSNYDSGSNHDSDTSEGLPYHALFAAAELKTPTAALENSTADQIPSKSGVPLVIHLINAHDYSDEDSKALLRGLIKESGDSCRKVIVFTTTEHALDGFGKTGNCNCYPCRNTDRDEQAAELSRLTGRRPHLRTTYAAPVRTAFQKRMFKTREDQQDSHAIRNIRAIKRAIREAFQDSWRQSSPVPSMPDILEPYTDWVFLAEALIYKRIVDEVLSKTQIDELVQEITNPKDCESIKTAILQTGSKTQALEEWSKSTDDSTTEAEDKTGPDKEPVVHRWEGFSEEIRAKLAKVEENDDSHQQALLENIIAPSDVGDTWADIAIDEKNQEHIMQVVSQKSDPAAYGLLRDQRLGGALLYGPPGTGKTHLARVLATESGALIISISSADIEDKYVGETEKIIKALFKLGRRLAPSIIFIDEADSLLSARSSDDKEWTRSRKSQFLLEMDGLKRIKDPPFVILATNFPTLLDPAIIRRVPARIFIGLPTLDLRKDIFKITLRDEDLDSTVDLNVLAQMTRGFSGSDIRTLCIQTAHISMSHQDGDRRLLTSRDFDEALDRCGPSVSRKAMADIKKFATDFDPRALKQFAELEREPAVVRSNPQPSGASDQYPPQIFNLSYSYETIPAEGTHIRVLSFEPQHPEISDTHATPLLSLRMHTVDIDDWTEEWTMMKSVLPEYTNCQLLAAWSEFQYFRDDSGSFLESEEFATIVEPLQSRSNGLYEPIELLTEVEPRFKWGDYLALSYVWGDPNLREDILLNGQRFSITASLHQTMISLAYSVDSTKPHLYFWADGICINQNDIEERALEIRKMTEIYSRCLSCRANLGASSPKLAESFRTLKTGLIQSAARHKATQMATPPQIDVNWIDEDEHFRVIARHLLAAAYWTRVWTLQECLLPPCTLFLYGEGTIELFLLVELLRVLSGRYADLKTRMLWSESCSGPTEEDMNLAREARYWDHRLATIYEARKPEKRQTARRADPRRPDVLTIADILALASFSRATESRDKIYGILALLPINVAQHISPSYEASNTYEKTILDFTLTCFEQMGNLNILAAIEHFEVPSPETVSWLPSFEMPRSYPQSVTSADSRVSFTSRLLAKMPYSANLYISPSLRKPFVQDQKLTCEGAFIGRVDNVHRFRFDSGRGNEVLQTAQPRIVELDEEVEDLSQRDDRFWKLSIARVLFANPKFEFTGSLSIFDMPWMQQEDFVTGPASGRWTSPQNIPQETNIPWKHIYMRKGKCFDFMWIIRLHSNVLVGNKPLKSYFSSQTEFCPSRRALAELELSLEFNLSSNLFTTVGGRLGLCSDFTQVDDQVVILADCCTPLILRKFGKHYKIISVCYIDGFMCGELADGISKRDYKLRQVSIA